MAFTGETCITDTPELHRYAKFLKYLPAYLRQGKITAEVLSFFKSIWKDGSVKGRKTIKENSQRILYDMSLIWPPSFATFKSVLGILNCYPFI